MDPLYCVPQGRAIHFHEHIWPYLDHMVGPHTHEETVKSRVVEAA